MYTVAVRINDVWVWAGSGSLRDMMSYMEWAQTNGHFAPEDMYVSGGFVGWGLK